MGEKKLHPMWSRLNLHTTERVLNRLRTLNLISFGSIALRADY